MNVWDLHVVFTLFGFFWLVVGLQLVILAKKWFQCIFILVSVFIIVNVGVFQCFIFCDVISMIMGIFHLG